MYIHSCIHRRSCMQRNVQICMHLPTHTHTPGPVQASGPSAHKSRARKTCPPLFSLLAHAYPCCHLQPHDYTKANLQISLPPPPPTTHTSKIWRALTDRPQPLFQGFSHLPIPVYVSPSSRGKQMSPRAVLCFSSDWV